MHRQIDWKVLKWSVGVVGIAAVLFGCTGNTVIGGGGPGGGSAGGSAGGGGVFPLVASVNLPDTPGSLQYVFLSGAGRAGDTETAVLRNLLVQDQLSAESSGLIEKTVTLTSYQSQILAANISLKGQQSRQFNNFILNATQYTSTDASGTQSFNSIINIPNSISSDIRVFTGRQTHVPLYLDPDTFNTVVTGGGGTAAEFDETWFDTINRVAGDSVAVRSYLSDYICFDIAAIPGVNKPSLSGGFGTANRAFFSGDGFAIASGDPAAGGAPFELIYHSGQGASVVGRYSAPVQLPSGSPVATTRGTYTTIGVDPSDVTAPDPAFARKITGFQGMWMYHYLQFKNPVSGAISDLGYLKDVHPFEAISIPSSLDDQRQQVVMFTQTLGTGADGTKNATVTSLMWGYLDLAIKKVRIYPLQNITDTNAITNRVGEVEGNIGAMYTSTGAATLSPQQMRFVDFTFTTPPAGFPATGKIVVVRR